jgi:hypothetical protein
MEKKHTESATLKAEAAIEDAFGLPPGDKTRMAKAGRGGARTCRMGP